MYFPEMTGTGSARIALLTVLLVPVFVFASDFQTPAITAQELFARQEGADPSLVIDVRDVAVTI